MPEVFLTGVVSRFLRDQGIADINPLLILDEIVQLSGLMRRTPDRSYQFMHAAIQDFLAAKYTVETGSFFPSTVNVWDARAGYAACLSGDATQSMIYSLRHGIDNIAFHDCLVNGAGFDSAQVATEVLRVLRRAPVRVVLSSTQRKDLKAIEV